MSLDIALQALIEGAYLGSNDIAKPVQDIAKRRRISLANGTLANQADLLFIDNRTIAASSSENLDLAAGVVDAFGATLTFAEVVGIAVFASDANANNVIVGGHASAAFLGPFGDATDTIAVKPGGFAFLVAPTNPAWPVTATTADMLKVANSGSGTGVTYDIVIIGRSA